MQKKTIQNEDLYSFMSNVQNITKRAVRLNHEQNQDKFERESMGALLQVSGYSFENLFNFLNKYPKIFDFENNIKKLQVMDGLSNILGNDYKHLNIYNPDDFKLLVGFLKSYFLNYTNDFDGSLIFNCKNNIEYGMKIGTVLICSSVDFLSSVHIPEKKKSIFFDSDSDININEIIKSIKEAFPEYKENENIKNSHNISQIINIVEKRDYDPSSFMGSIQDKVIGKNEVYIDYIELGFEDKITYRPSFYSNSILYSNGYFCIDGLKYFFNPDISEYENSQILFSYFYEVAKKMNVLDDIVIKTNIEKINDLKNDYAKLLEESNDDDDTDDEKEFLRMCFYSYLQNIKYGIFENISKGLYKSFENALKDIEINRIAWHTIRKSILNKKWEKIEESLYTRISQK